MTAPAETTELTRLGDLLRALSSAPRLQIVRVLAEHGSDEPCCSREVCACVFAEQLGLSASTVSHHMKALIDAGLVTSEKRGLWVYYRLVPATLAEVGRELLELAEAASPEGERVGEPTSGGVAAAASGCGGAGGCV